MIIKMQSVLFPYAGQREEKKPIVLTKRDKVYADRLVMIFLFAIIIVTAIVLS